ncbi:MAG: hypothetical protein HY849_05835 [Nitrosomonadales bacterium]|nr:hypothetical protein [Nitrosomonadales bacterium]
MLSALHPDEPALATALPSTRQLLVAGGDARIALDAAGLNRYGCAPLPDPTLHAFGSSTATGISATGWAAADALRQRLAASAEPAAERYAQELERMRGELATLCELSDLSGLATVFAASGTDLHLIAAQLLARRDVPSVAIMADASETGSGIPTALRGRHFSSRAAQRSTVPVGTAITGAHASEVVSVALRQPDGSIRPSAEVDAEFRAQCAAARAAGKQVLLILTDLSKTGLIAPTPGCVAELHRQHSAQLEVLVDACQFRLAPASLRAYLQQGYSVAITGSKFLSGPTFSGALLIPAVTAERLRDQPLPCALADYTCRAEWPRGWSGAECLSRTANFGLLLRWEAALAELKAFRALPDTAIARFLQDFAAAIQHRLAHDPALLPLPVTELERGTDGWDCIPTLFPFLLRRPDGRILDEDETQRIYRQLPLDLSREPDFGPDAALAASRFQLGQPVAGGLRTDAAVSALRLCLSARLIVEALTEASPATVIARALTALDKAALLSQEG